MKTSHDSVWADNGGFWHLQPIREAISDRNIVTEILKWLYTKNCNLIYRQA